jgi:hypothetical protein
VSGDEGITDIAKKWRVLKFTVHLRHSLTKNSVVLLPEYIITNSRNPTEIKKASSFVHDHFGSCLQTSFLINHISVCIAQQWHGEC